MASSAVMIVIIGIFTLLGGIILVGMRAFQGKPKRGPLIGMFAGLFLLILGTILLSITGQKTTTEQNSLLINTPNPSLQVTVAISPTPSITFEEISNQQGLIFLCLTSPSRDEVNEIDLANRLRLTYQKQLSNGTVIAMVFDSRESGNQMLTQLKNNATTQEWSNNSNFTQHLVAWYIRDIIGEIDKVDIYKKVATGIETKTINYNTTIHVTAKVLYSSFKENQIAAEQNYKGKTLLVSGVVDSISRDVLGNAYVLLTDGSAYSVWGVQCFFIKENENNLVNLSKGQQVRIIGDYYSYSLNVQMRFCEIR